jgi:hypothetical protein
MKEYDLDIKGMIDKVKINECVTAKTFPKIIAISLLLIFVSSGVNAPSFLNQCMQ